MSKLNEILNNPSLTPEGKEVIRSFMSLVYEAAMVEGTSAITASDVLGEVTETLRQKGEGALADKLHGVTLAFARVVVSTGTAFAETVLATEVITARIRG